MGAAGRRVASEEDLRATVDRDDLLGLEPGAIGDAVHLREDGRVRRLDLLRESLRALENLTPLQLRAGLECRAIDVDTARDPLARLLAVLAPALACRAADGDDR